MKKDQLPVIKNKKKIDVKKLVKLAKRVRKYFEEEQEYLEKQKRKDEISKATGIYLDN